jgi:hypothetical protein
MAVMRRRRNAFALHQIMMLLDRFGGGVPTASGG